MPPRKKYSKSKDNAFADKKTEKMTGKKRLLNESSSDEMDGKRQRLDDNTTPPVTQQSNSNQKSNNDSSSNTETTDKEAPAIGIDLGTTYSCVGVFQHGKVEIIANDQGNKITPSYVAFTDEELLVGDAAQVQATRYLYNTIFGVKRLIGRRFEDPIVQNDMKKCPFQIINDNSRPKIKVIVNDEIQTCFPEEISALVLAKMKETAEAYIGKTVTKAVITVPAYFTDSQRQATKDAAAIAKLDVLRIINEPTAAAIAYGLEKKVDDECKVMVFDLGGGTFDVSILNVAEDFFEVISTGGDTHLGGEDFDNRMVDHFVKEFGRKYGMDLTQNKKAIRRLRTACEQAKRRLSTYPLASVDLPSLYEGIDFYSAITRARFDEINADLFQKTLETVKKNIRDAGIGKSEIQEVVLVGGSTRIPKVQKLLQDFFDGKELCNSINPDEAVAYGAAIQAAVLNDDSADKLKNLLLVDVAPLSLGIHTIGDMMSNVIKRNTTIPTKQTELFTTTRENQDYIFVRIYEGENPDSKQNNLLGTFKLEGIPPAPKGVPNIEVTFDLDADGILDVTAVDKASGSKNGITLRYNKNCFSHAEIERMIRDAEIYKEKLKEQKTLSNAKKSLESFCLDLKKTVQDVKVIEAIIESDKNLIMKKCDEVIEWIHSNNSNEVKIFEQKQAELDDTFYTIITIAKYPERKEEKYREVLNVRNNATYQEIREGYRKATRKYHPDKVKGDKEVGKMMFRIAVSAEKFLSKLVR